MEDALIPFLDLLRRDLASRPEAMVALTPALMARIAAATEGVSIDVDAPIEGDVEI
jgi:antitoxin PrlF